MVSDPFLVSGNGRAPEVIEEARRPQSVDIHPNRVDHAQPASI
jgi:hypothetical protein